MKRFISIPTETFVYIVIMVVVMISAMIREINLLIVLSGLMLGPLVVSWQVVRMTLTKISCRRRLPDAVYPGEIMTIELVVKNERKRLDSWSLVLEDRFKWTSGPAMTKRKPIAAKSFLPNVPAGETRTATYRGQLWHRGKYRLGPIKISTRVPIGLIRGTIVVPDSTAQILVYPRLGIVSQRWNELVKVEQMGHRSSRKNQGNLEGDFFGLRGWRSGDSRRWIHWRSTAKRNEIVVLQFEQTRNQNFVILLDLYSSDSEAMETAISFTATIIIDQCRRHGGHLILGIGGAKLRFVQGSASNAFVHDALEQLAECKAATEDLLPELLDQGTTSVSADDRLVVVTANDFDPSDTTRFSSVWNDRHKRRALTKAISVNVTQPEFSDWFRLDEPTNGEHPLQDQPNQRGVSLENVR